MTVSTVERGPQILEKEYIEWDNDINLYALPAGVKVVVFLSPGNMGSEAHRLVRLEIQKDQENPDQIQVRAVNNHFNIICADKLEECLKKWKLGLKVGQTEGVMPIDSIGTNKLPKRLDIHEIYQKGHIISCDPNNPKYFSSYMLTVTDWVYLGRKIDFKVIFGEDRNNAQILRAGFLKNGEQGTVLPKAA